MPPCYQMEKLKIIVLFSLSKLIHVEVDTLDNFLSHHSINQKIDFVKMDVEGMEYQVLEGMKQILSKYKPILYLETLISTEGALGFPVLKHIEEYLKSLDYKLYAFDAKGFREVQYLYLPENTIAINKN